MLFRRVRPFSFAREKVRRLSGRDARALRTGRARCGNRLSCDRFRAVRGNARGAGRAPARRAAACLARRSDGRSPVHRARNKGDIASEYLPRSAFARVRVLLRARRVRVLAAALGRRRAQRPFICGNERRVRRSRILRNGEVGAPSRTLFGDRGIPDFSERGLHSEFRIPRGRRGGRRGDAFFAGGTRKQNLFCGGRVRGADFSRVVRLSVAFGLRKIARRKKIRRDGSGAARGVCGVARRSYGRHTRALSRGRCVRRGVFSVLHFSRVLFQEVPRESTSPPPARRG